MPVWTLYGIKRGVATNSWPEGKEPVQPGVQGLPRFYPTGARRAAGFALKSVCRVQSALQNNETAKDWHLITASALPVSCARNRVPIRPWRNRVTGLLAFAGAKTWSGQKPWHHNQRATSKQRSTARSGEVFIFATWMPARATAANLSCRR